MPGFSISWYTPESRHSVSPGSLIASMPAHCLIFRKEEIGGSSNSYPRLHMREGGADRGSSASTALTEEPVPPSQPAPCSVFWEVPLFPYSYILLSEVGSRAASSLHLHRHCCNYSTTAGTAAKLWHSKGTAEFQNQPHNSFISEPRPQTPTPPPLHNSGTTPYRFVQKINQ